MTETCCTEKNKSLAAIAVTRNAYYYYLFMFAFVFYWSVFQFSQQYVLLAVNWIESSKFFCEISLKQSLYININP